MRKMLAKLAAVCLMAVILAGCSTAKLAADPAPETPAIPATPAAPVVAKAWTEVATWRGDGTKSTETFSIKSSEWRILWATKIQLASASIKMLQIMVYNEKGELVALAANTTNAGDDFSYVRSKPGNYYLEIMSLNCDWAIAVEDIR